MSSLKQSSVLIKSENVMAKEKQKGTPRTTTFSQLHSN